MLDPPPRSSNTRFGCSVAVGADDSIGPVLETCAPPSPPELLTQPVNASAPVATRALLQTRQLVSPPIASLLPIAPSFWLVATYIFSYIDRHCKRGVTGSDTWCSYTSRSCC